MHPLTRLKSRLQIQTENQMMKATTLITLGILAGSVSFAAAQDKPAERPQRGGDRPVPAEVLKKFDKDGDGKLSEEERKAFQEERKAEALKKYDKDGDGKLSDEEKKAQQEDLAAKRKALTDKYDANKNGKLDPEEIKAARDAGEELPAGGRGQGGGRGERGAKPAEGAEKPADKPE